MTGWTCNPDDGCYYYSNYFESILIYDLLNKNWYSIS